MKTPTSATLLAVALLAGCSLALDMDALQAGSDTDTDTTPDCASNADCDDGVDCTVDTCGEDGTCGHSPDNDLCASLPYCDPQQGCVPTGDECKVNSDCDDDIACTADTCILAGTANYCENDPDDSICEADDPCVVGEFCSAETGCVEGAPLVCPPTAAPCMDSVCDPLDGTCIDVYVDGSDDDDDSYLDESCGGDDCDDDDGDVHPSAEEDCDNVDDDCDGYTDLSIIADAVTVADAAVVESPAVACDGTTYAVTWQQGSVAAGEVYARFLSYTGGMISDPHNFTALGGTGAIGITPALAAADDGFYAVWVSRAGADPSEVLLVPLSVDTGTGIVSHGTLVQLDDGTAQEVSVPVVGWDDPSAGSGWTAAWKAAWSGGDQSVELRTEDMHSMAAAGSFTVAAGPGEVDGVSLIVLGPDDYLLSFSRVDTGTDGDLEVFETRVGLAAGDVWDHLLGFPAMISAVNPTNDDDSWQPSSSPDGAGGWVTAFTDTEVLGATAFTRNIQAWDGAARTALQQSSSYMQTDPALARDDASFGLLYLSSVGSAVALEWRQFDDDTLALLDPPYLGTRFDLASGAQDLRAPRLVANGAGGYAAVVVRDDGVQDNLLFYTFEGCVPVTK